MAFGNSRRWLIVKRAGMWTVCPPAGARKSGACGGMFRTGVQALDAFASGGPRCGDECGELHRYRGTCKMRTMPA